MNSSVDIFELQWPFLREVLKKKQVVSDEDIDPAIVELKKYLVLTQTTNKPLAMVSHTIDEVWHCFLLFTRQYREFCEQWVGGLIDHLPNTEATPVPNEAMRNFVEAYTESYGPLPAIWTKTMPPEVVNYIFGRTEVLPEQFRWSGWPGRK